MRCKECLPLLEEYFDGELETAMSGSIAAHVAACAECASVCMELHVDQEMYSHYRRQIAGTSAPWESFRARIESARESISPSALLAPPARPFMATLGIIPSLFNSRYVFAPALLITVAVIVGLLMRFNQNAKHPLLASPPPKVESAGLAPKQTENISSIPVGSPGPAARGASTKQDGTQVLLAGDRSPNRTAVSSLESKLTSGMENKTRPQSLKRRNELGAFSGATALDAKADVRRPVRIVLTAYSKNDVSKHVEGAQVFLRAFRNQTAAGRVEALDLSYEKRLARNMLGRNILLRRDAENRRNLPDADLLGSLEPVLIDVANIEGRASPDEVRAIVGRMEKKGIVAKLQVRAARPAGPNFRIGSLD